MIVLHSRSLFLAAFMSALLGLHNSVHAQASGDGKSGGTFNAPGYAPDQNSRSREAGGAATPLTPPTGAGGRRSTGSTVRPMDPSVRPAEQETAQRAPDAAPRKPSEFQKFVEAATGRLLPIFGASFFTDSADALSGPDNIPVASDYALGPGDEVILRAWGSIDVDYRTTVDRNGLLNLPKVGAFSVTGVKASELEKHLRAQIGRLYTNFNLSAAIGQLRGVKVFVVGPVHRSGVYTLPGQSTMLSAVAAAGGPAPYGSMRKVVLRRDGRDVSELDLYDFLVLGDKSKDIQLSPGDVIVFQPAGPRVALAGALDLPAIYELKSASESVREVLRYAGGAPLLADRNRAQLERIDPTQSRAVRFVEEFRLDADGQQKALRDGDLLTLLAISPRFANAVTLKGHVAQPLRYPFRVGMRIRDLIPDREALISPEFYRRKNLLVQVAEPEEDDRFEAGAKAEGMNGSVVDPQDRAGERSPVRPLANTSGEPGQRATRRQRGSSSAFEDLAAANRAKRTPAALFDELNWDYAVIERLIEKDLSTQLIPFNLGKAVLDADPTHNLELLSGDVVTVYSQKDVRVPVARQTRLVSVEGEVQAPGVYQLQPGETLAGLIKRAGGFTPHAYVYGLDFSREETRQRQRENLASAIARLEALAATQNARDAANRRDDSSAANQSAVSNAATQAQLARLSRIQPNGRIALELRPDVSSLDALPDVPLDHADRISVPSRPAFVTVAGAVVNSNAFLWKKGRTAGDYLKLAGVDEAADPSNMFILRADGTVNHAGDKRSFWGGNALEGEVMQPGDAVIVPNQLDFETWGRALVRNLKDWSQIFSGFGIGIAAINSLKD
jgi:polysaccharide biosynthesis/export protein